MINLTDTKFGQKRKLIIGGINTFDIFNKSLNVVFYVQLIDLEGNLLSDPSLNQNRKVVYSVNNSNYVNSAFDPVSINTVGSRKEYDYFFELLQTTVFTTLIIQLANKLIQRGLFD